MAGLLDQCGFMTHTTVQQYFRYFEQREEMGEKVRVVKFKCCKVRTACCFCCCCFFFFCLFFFVLFFFCFFLDIWIGSFVF